MRMSTAIGRSFPHLLPRSFSLCGVDRLADHDNKKFDLAHSGDRFALW